MQASVVTVLPVNYTVAAGRRLDSFLLCGFLDVIMKHDADGDTRYTPSLLNPFPAPDTIWRPLQCFLSAA